MTELLSFAFHLADLADATTMRWFDPEGVPFTSKQDGTPVTDADAACEEALRAEALARFPEDAFLGEEVGATAGASERRWIVDGIDGTAFFAAGRPTWGTLIALEDAGIVTCAVITSPALRRRWWAERGAGAFTAPTGGRPTGLRVSDETRQVPGRVAVFPAPGLLLPRQQVVIESLAGGMPPDRPWSHAAAVASGEVDVCVWFDGGPWDLAACSLLVEEAGGRFTDHAGGNRLDSRTALYSNGRRHEEILTALATLR